MRLRTSSSSGPILVRGSFRFFNTFIKYGFLTLIARYCYLGIATMAGKETIGNIAISLITNLTMNQWMAYAIGGGGIAYGTSQRSLRKSTVERLQSRNQELELRIDPNRTSSMLTTRGDTRPEDNR